MPSGSSAHRGTGPARRWLILVIVLCASVMDQLDTTVVNVAAPSVQADIGGGPATIQWLAAGYSLAFAVCLITGGRLGDIYGRRRMFLLGTAGFTAASTACGLAPAPGALIAARVIQGAFGALLIPQGLGILKAVFPPRELGSAFGLFAPVMGLASVSGPVLGGTLIDSDLFGSGWRMVFLINLPVGVITLAAAAGLLPRRQKLRRMRLDFVGVGIMTVAAVLMVYPLVQGRALGWPGWIWGMLAGGCLMFGVFALHQRTTRRASVIETSLLRNRVYLAGLTIAVVFFAAVSGLTLVLSLYGQLGLHFTPAYAALAGIPMSLGITGSGLFAARLTARYGRTVLHAGLALLIAGLAVLSLTVTHFGVSLTAADLIPATAVTGAGMGLVFGPLFRTILSGVGDREVGSASGTLSAVQQFGGSLGVAVISTMYFGLTAGPAPAADAMAFTAAFAALISAIAFGLVFLLPRRQPPDPVT